MLNTILSLIPDELPVVGYENLYLQGGLSSNPTIKNDYLILPLDLSLHDKALPLSL
jgi:hypothetical protein